MKLLWATLLITIMYPHSFVYYWLPHDFEVPSSISSSPVVGQDKYHRIVLQLIVELIFFWMSQRSLVK